MSGHRPTGEFVSRAYAALFFIYKRPRTQPELMELTGCNRDTARRYLKSAVSEGLVEVVAKRKNPQGPDSPVYGMVKL